MNKLFLTLCSVFLFVFFTSCTGEDIQDSSNTSLNGIWTLTSLTLTTPLDINNDGISTLNVLEEAPIIQATLDLKNDLMGTILYNSKVTINSRNENGSLFFMIASLIDSDNSPLPIQYFKSDDMITVNDDITFNHITNGVSVLKLDENKLSMTVVNGFVVEDVNTAAESVSQNVTYVFTKQ